MDNRDNELTAIEHDLALQRIVIDQLPATADHDSTGFFLDDGAGLQERAIERSKDSGVANELSRDERVKRQTAKVLKRGTLHWRNVLAGLWLTACLALAGAFASGIGWTASDTPSDIAENSEDPGRTQSRKVRPVANRRPMRPRFCNIEDIDVGDRVLAHNPEISEESRALRHEPDWSEWRLLQLEMTKSDGSALHIEMLRPRQWCLVTGAEEGAKISLELPEMDIEGEAHVRTNSIAPAIELGAGQVVTATFKQTSSIQIIDVLFEGEPSPIGVTVNHPFWSVDNECFLPIGILDVGALVQTSSGETRRIQSKVPRKQAEIVYNLEVNGEHTYFVGEQGILAHNTCPKWIYAALRKVDGEVDSVAYVGIGDLARAKSIRQRVADALFNGNLKKADRNFEFRMFELSDEFEARGMEQAMIDAFGGRDEALWGLGWKNAWKTAHKRGSRELWNASNSFIWDRTTSPTRLALFQKAYNNLDLFKRTFKKLFPEFNWKFDP